MINKRYLFTIIFIFCQIGAFMFANNLQISNINLKDKNTIEKYVHISFDISWDNSWRLSSEPVNWDASWVFIKFRLGSGAWQHATISSNSLEHTAPAGSVINPTSDGKGIFIYRSEVGSGTNNWTGVTLKWNYGQDEFADDASGLEVKVFGIEMVYVPQANFYLGDGSSEGRFWNAADVNTNPALISDTPIVLKCDDTYFDDDQFETDGILVDGDGGIDMDGNTAVDNNSYPTGYQSFYCMKYEITNQQYADFLNTISRLQQNTRTYFDISTNTVTHPFPINHQNVPESRNSVRYEISATDADGPVNFFCDLNNNGQANDHDDGANIVCCNIGWADGAAFSDWAGLRPMTELEYEKACRGTEYPVNDEYAWHTSNIYGNYDTEYIFNNIDSVGTINSYPTNPGAGIYANAQYKFTTGHDTQHDAPLRCGMFATSTSDRVNSGASYYGIMELSGSMTERMVTIGNIEGRAFEGTHGDGYLTTGTGIAGNATNSDWPGIVTGEESDGIKTDKGAGLKGGDWNDDPPMLQVSMRRLAAGDPYFEDGKGNIGSGFRCVRSAGN